MKAICPATLLFLVLGCSQPTQSNSDKQNPLPPHEIDSALTVKADNQIASVSISKVNSLADKSQSGIVLNHWLDSLLEKYLLLSENEMVRLAVKDKLKEEWLYDQTIQTDTATYWVYAFGHSVVDNDGARFIHDQWVYIDSANRRLYEVDFSNDSISLIPWSK